ncbi:MAG TPA: dTDP-glucose 4,6-dehydratase [Candidatus Brocadiia bacterium]|nr:dTDP-glucose 4,6-dehydratase [Candidatus Brocadiia bacterium]
MKQTSKTQTILVTGGAGFIGSHFARLAARRGMRVIVLDKLTYAGNPENLEDIRRGRKTAGLLEFYRGDICNAEMVEHVFAREGIDFVVNFAAETHVDRSLLGAGSFIDTDVRGVHVLLEACLRHKTARFIQVSTDEVYGSVAEGSSKESDTLSPRNPYSAAKTGGELLARSYWTSHGLPVIVTRGSNTYGPNQYPEKLLPLFATNAIDGQPLPLYGDGLQVRDWLHATDHCSAIFFLMEKGEPGEAYNVPGGNERTNLEMTRVILDELGRPESLIRRVEDRPGHDRRYSIDGSKLRALGWRPAVLWEQGVRKTVRWYAENGSWWRPLRSGEFLEYYKRQYGKRLGI